MEERFSIVKNKLSTKFTIPTLDAINASGNSLSDIEATVTVMGVRHTGKVINLTESSTLVNGLQNGIRGFIYVLLLIYNINQAYKLIRGTSLAEGSMYAGRMKE